MAFMVAYNFIQVPSSPCHEEFRQVYMLANIVSVVCDLLLI